VEMKGWNVSNFWNFERGFDKKPPCHCGQRGWIKFSINFCCCMGLQIPG